MTLADELDQQGAAIVATLEGWLAQPDAPIVTRHAWTALERDAWVVLRRVAALNDRVIASGTATAEDLAGLVVGARVCADLVRAMTRVLFLADLDEGVTPPTQVH
jgi:hypothetical protein